MFGSYGLSYLSERILNDLNHFLASYRDAVTLEVRYVLEME
jgi:hypothetical protein